MAATRYKSIRDAMLRGMREAARTAWTGPTASTATLGQLVSNVEREMLETAARALASATEKTRAPAIHAAAHALNVVTDPNEIDVEREIARRAAERASEIAAGITPTEKPRPIIQIIEAPIDDDDADAEPVTTPAEANGAGASH